MIVYSDDVNDIVDYEDYLLIKELIEEDRELNKVRNNKKKELINRYPDKFSDALKAKYGIGVSEAV